MAISVLLIAYRPNYCVTHYAAHKRTKL